VAAELAHFILANVRLAPSTADRISQRLHAALAEESLASRPAMGAGWAAALAGAGAAGALALMLIPGLFSPGSSAGRSMANPSLPQGPAQGLTDPLQPISQLPGAVALSRAPDDLAPKDPILPAKEQALAAEAPAQVSGPKGLAIPGLAALPTISASLAPVSAPAASGPGARPAPTASPTPFKALAGRGLTRTAGARLTPGMGALKPLNALPGMAAATPSASLPQSSSLPGGLPETSLTAPSGATGTASH
jgi:hypothetical protein